MTSSSVSAEKKRSQIEEALRASNGNRSEAARQLPCTGGCVGWG